MKPKFALCLALLALLVSACGLSEADVQVTLVAVQTGAAETVHAQYTQIALLTPSATATLPPTPTPEFTATPEATATSEQAAVASGTCDVMGFDSDVTVADGEQIAAGTAFTKTWRLSNQGTCTWDTTYSVVYFSGDQMNGPASQFLTESVAPGATVDVSVDLIAPTAPGTYSSFWVLANAAGETFGSFYVEIEVP